MWTICVKVKSRFRVGPRSDNTFNGIHQISRGLQANHRPAHRVQRLRTTMMGAIGNAATTVSPVTKPIAAKTAPAAASSSAAICKEPSTIITTAYGGLEL